MVSTGKSPSDSSARQGVSSSASGSKYAQKLNELEDKGSLQAGDPDLNQTRHMLAKYNYAVREKELSVQCEEQTSKLANAEVEFWCQVDLKKLDIELKLTEENAVTKQVQLLQLQIKLAEIKSMGNADSEMDGSSHHGG